MTELKQTELLLNDLNRNALPKDIMYIGSAGFEDRSLGFLKDTKVMSKAFKLCIAIEYLPLNPKNRKAEFVDLASGIFETVQWKIYDRKCPENFAQALNEIVDVSQSVSRIIIDISGMSKMLIVVLLFGLRKLDIPLSIIYAPAKVYHPLKEKYEEEKAKSKFPDVFPYFLTSDVYTVVTTTELSSRAMQGAPLARAFPNFNHREISALLNETNTQKLILIESIKCSPQNNWRLEAIQWINRGLKTYIEPIIYETDASDINENIRLLERIYGEYHLSHKVALSPTGGKLQAVATSFLKIMHPDIHIVYPVVRQFAEEYTEGYFAHSEIFFKSFREYTNMLDNYRRSELAEIQQILASKMMKKKA